MKDRLKALVAAVKYCRYEMPGETAAQREARDLSMASALSALKTGIAEIEPYYEQRVAQSSASGFRQAIARVELRTLLADANSLVKLVEDSRASEAGQSRASAVF